MGFFRKLDELAGIETENTLAKWLERIAFVFLVLMFLSAPHSIAATQISWFSGMFFWWVRYVFIKPRPSLTKTPLNIALWVFALWTILTCVVSYAPDISLGRLQNVLVLLIFFFVLNNLRTKRAAVFLVFGMIVSCMVNVGWTAIERVGGRGFEITAINPESPLFRVGIISGDTLLSADNRKILSLEELEAKIESQETTELYFYRPDFYYTVKPRRTDLLKGTTAAERLGIESWKRGYKWRAQGFYSHPATYSEVLQMIASLAFGLLIASFLARSKTKEQRESGSAGRSGSRAALNKYHLLFAVCLAGCLFSLLLATTRASQISLILSAFLIIWHTGRRRMLIVLAAVVLPLAIIGAVYLQENRRVGVIDTSDGSVKYRMMMYRDGMRVWTESPRNFLLGIGMDSIKRYWEKWDMFDKGWQPMGHFHSTILQLVIERGLPSIFLWLWVLWLYARMLWRGIKTGQAAEGRPFDWKKQGVLLGCFGGLAGFFISSLVQNNLGDTTVAMVFYMLMGLGVKLAVSDDPDKLTSNDNPEVIAD